MSITVIPGSWGSTRTIEAVSAGEVGGYLDLICEEGELSVGLFDGLEGALVGWTVPCPGREVLAVYDWGLMVGICEGWGMSEEEAEEYLEFNTVGAWFGEQTPVIIRIPRRG